MAADTERFENHSIQIQSKGQRGGARQGAGRKPGQRNQTVVDGQKLAQKWGPAAIEAAAKLAGLITAKDGKPDGMAASEAVRASALSIIIDRAFGKAAQPLNHGDNEGGKISPALNIFGSGDGKPAPARKAGTGVSEHSD